MTESLGDMLSLKEAWRERHPDAVLIDCPQCGPPHQIEVCAECGWPPALDGHCRCEVEQ